VAESNGNSSCGLRDGRVTRRSLVEDPFMFFEDSNLYPVPNASGDMFRHWFTDILARALMANLYRSTARKNSGNLSSDERTKLAILKAERENLKSAVVDSTPNPDHFQTPSLRSNATKPHSSRPLALPNPAISSSSSCSAAISVDYTGPRSSISVLARYMSHRKGRSMLRSGTRRSDCRVGG
jgi:hypothetical protein